MINQNQLNQLKRYFADQPVDVVYLFGSQATKKTTPLSDFDFSVLFQDCIDSRRRFDLVMKYTVDLGSLFKTDKVDVLDLNRSPLFFRYAAIAPRKDLVVKNERKRIDFEQRTMSEYFDRLYYLKRHTQYSLAGFAERGFGLNE